MEVETDNIYMRENADLSRIVASFDRNNVKNAENDGGATRKHMRMDLPRGQSVHVVDEVRRGVLQPLPREDGYIDTFEEARHASERPFSRQYLQMELDRMMALQKDTFYQFVTYVSGFTAIKVLDLLNHDDLSRRLLERQRAQRISRQETERSVVSVTEKRKQLTETESRVNALRNNLARLRDDGTLPALVDAGHQLVELLWLKLLELKLRLDTVLSSDPPAPEENTLTPEQLSDEISASQLRKLVESGKNDYTYGVLMRFGQRLHILFDTVLDLASDNARLLNTVEQRLSDGERRIRTPFVPKEDTEEKSPVVRVDENELLSNSVVRNVLDIFGLNTYLLAYRGAKLEYSQWKSNTSARPYPMWANAFITTQDETVLRNLGKEFNIFGSGAPDGQPPEVARLISQATGGRTDADAVKIASEVMWRHFLWLYFTERSDAGLAVDAEQMGLEVSTKVAAALVGVRDAVENALNKTQPVLALFFDSVRATLTAQRVLHDPSDATPVVRLSFTLFELPRKASFKEQNEAMKKSVSVEQMIVDSDFELYYLTGRSGTVPLDWLRQDVGPVLSKQQPLLQLYSLFRAYASYVRLYKRQASERLQHEQETVEHLERKIDELVRETNSLGGEPRRSEYVQNREFTSLPVNSGVIALSATAQAALDQAKNMVRDYCGNLAQLASEEDLYGKQAIESGLANDFALLVSCNMSRIGLRNPSRYNTTIQVQGTLMDTDSVLDRLRRYSVRSRGLAGWSIVVTGLNERRDTVFSVGGVHSF
jgi:uncharacterized protein Yka (UPF0111/DUF47 family)